MTGPGLHIPGPASVLRTRHVQFARRDDAHCGARSRENRSRDRLRRAKSRRQGADTSLVCHLRPRPTTVGQSNQSSPSRLVRPKPTASGRGPEEVRTVPLCVDRALVLPPGKPDWRTTSTCHSECRRAGMRNPSAALGTSLAPQLRDRPDLGARFLTRTRKSPGRVRNESAIE